MCSHIEDLNARNKCLTAKFSNRVIRIIRLERLIPSSIADTMNWFQNSMSVENLFYINGDFSNRFLEKQKCVRNVLAVV